MKTSDYVDVSLSTYGGCSFAYVVAYLEHVDWLAVIATILTVLGLINDYINKRKKAREREEIADKQLNQIQIKNNRDIELQVEELQRLLELEKEKNRETLKRLDDLMALIINKNFRDLS